MIGFYYDSEGKPTENRDKIEELMKIGNQQKEDQAAMSKKYPRCNSQRGVKVRDKVWCSNKSGGVDRKWIGYPRLFRDPTTPNTNLRCACVHPDEASDTSKFQMYDNCGPLAHECFLDDKDGYDPNYKSHRSRRDSRRNKQEL